MFCKEDVWAEPIEPQRCHKCGDDTSGPLATHRVMIEVRGVGTTIMFGEGCYADGDYCESCANEIVSRIHETLPPTTTAGKE